MDRFHELNAFIAVAEAGGFSAAARRTGLAQPAVSKAIAALEKRLGVALFNRSTRNVTLTDHGQRYFERTKLMIEELDDADNEMTNSALRVSGPVRISVPSTFGRLHVLPLIPELLTLYPELAVDLVLSDIVRDMVDDRVDLAIRVGAIDEPDAVVRRVAATPLVCVGSLSYFRDRGVPQTPADLVKHNCLIYGGLREAANWPFVGPDGPFSVSVRGNLSSNSIETIRAAVLAGVGIGFFTKGSLVGGLSGPDVVTVLDGFVRGARDVNLVWPNRRFVPARVRRTTEFFTEAIPKRLSDSGHVERTSMRSF
ncbi:LysR family transcriptional regulator [Lichenifustis flavocetrariae]|uniref:LysR family transcriptional regulator n=1 Tax=Lichenifustis flavocetrariae TaxID=2949735 RepID=A0AA41YZN0_9HYPH|nr:LysR family transcriptional regulator [Lichenifustis flavocetrariae]MCW6511504.1 LysR family transcriptional regulator [Lichenifustis flavocetrariae]